MTPTPTAALLLTGALLAPLAGCGQPAVPAPAPEARPQAPGGLKSLALPLAAAGEEAGDGFRFPDDKGGQVLARALPAEKSPAPAEDGAPLPKRLPAAVPEPSPPLPLLGPVPRLPAGRLSPLRPRPLPEELPLAGSRPEPPPLPSGDRVRLPGPDVSRPAALPLLATPAPDRGSSDDPTAGFSAAAAQAARVPPREAPAPFTKVGLPDPFENRDAVRLREPPPEKSEPVGK